MNRASHCALIDATRDAHDPPQSRQSGAVSGAKRDYRAILTLYRASTLTDAERGDIANWLHAQANFVGNDDTGRRLSTTFTARRYD